ncbi:MAG: MBL fold metallo-hydrolase [Streptosporangiaceae bacterium]
MRLTVLGGCGAWPEAGQACSGFLVEQDGFRLLLEAGYATLPRLLGLVSAAQLDAVFISHGHPDHCADLNPLLRARALGGAPVPPLPVFAPPGALDAVLALDRPGMLAGACTVTEFRPGDRLGIGPFRAETRLLPHWLPNAGLRLMAAGQALAYTGDSGDSPDITALARDADLLLAEATYVDQVPPADQPFLSCARRAGQQAAQAGVARLMLTHLWPGTSPVAAEAAAAGGYGGGISVAVAGLATDV